MDIRGKKLVAIGGAGLIGSHTVDLLTKEDIGEIVINDNFVRGTAENLNLALRYPRAKIVEAGTDICQGDVLHAALNSADAVFNCAALWLLQFYEFPRAAFDVNVAPLNSGYFGPQFRGFEFHREFANAPIVATAGRLDNGDNISALGRLGEY